MYDIYFDLNNMHQTVQESDDIETDEEFWKDVDQFELDFGGPPAQDDFPVIVKKSTKRNSNGCICKKCGELYPFAEPNRKDGSFKCWSCRNF